MLQPISLNMYLDNEINSKFTDLTEISWVILKIRAGKNFFICCIKWGENSPKFPAPPCSTPALFRALRRQWAL